MNERPTPETDEASFSTVYQGELVKASFARLLERQRDELLAACDWALSELGKHTRPSPLDKAIAAVKGDHT